MSFMEWSDQYILHEKVIDDQHCKLFEIVNSMYDAVMAGAEQSNVGRLLDELIDYTVYHFETEEELFLKSGYPKYNDHKSEHDDLTRQALELQGKFRDRNITISFEVMEFLSDWLKKHTTESDQEYVAFVKSTKKQI